MSLYRDGVGFRVKGQGLKEEGTSAPQASFNLEGKGGKRVRDTAEPRD